MTAAAPGTKCEPAHEGQSVGGMEVLGAQRHYLGERGAVPREDTLGADRLRCGGGHFGFRAMAFALLRLLMEESATASGRDKRRGIGAAAGRRDRHISRRVLRRGLLFEGRPLWII